MVEPSGVNAFEILVEFRSHEPMCAHSPNLNEQKLWAAEGAQGKYSNHGKDLKECDIILIEHLSSVQRRKVKTQR